MTLEDKSIKEALKKRDIKCPTCFQADLWVCDNLFPKETPNFDNITAVLCSKCGHIMHFNRRILTEKPIAPSLIARLFNLGR